MLAAAQGGLNQPPMVASPTDVSLLNASQQLGLAGMGPMGAAEMITALATKLAEQKSRADRDDSKDRKDDRAWAKSAEASLVQGPECP